MSDMAIPQQTTTDNTTTPASLLRQRMDKGVVGLPGAFNGLAARLAKDAGFQGLYVSGAAVTASYGVPDIGLLTLNEFTSVIRQVWLGSRLPIIADADTGFGEEEMVRRVVHEYALAGAAGFHIEDQVFPKRCGHLDGKALVPMKHFAEKVAAAASAARELPSPDGKPAFLVCARTDAAGVEGVDACIDRAKASIDAGAEMIFPEGLRTEEDFERVAKALREYSNSTYLLANMTEFGKTPIINLKRFGEMGYHTVIWPVSSLRSAMGEAKRFYRDLSGAGDVSGTLDRMLTRAELYEALGYTPGEPWSFGS